MPVCLSAWQEGPIGIAFPPVLEKLLDANASKILAHFDPDMSLISLESVPHLVHQVVDVGRVKRCGQLNPESSP